MLKSHMFKSKSKRLSLLIIEIIHKENSKVTFESSCGKKSQFQKESIILNFWHKNREKGDGFYISKLLILYPNFRI